MPSLLTIVSSLSNQTTPHMYHNGKLIIITAMSAIVSATRCPAFLRWNSTCTKPVMANIQIIAIAVCIIPIRNCSLISASMPAVPKNKALRSTVVIKMLCMQYDAIFFSVFIFKDLPRENFFTLYTTNTGKMWHKNFFKKVLAF